MFLCQDLAFFLAWVRMKTCNGSDYPEESSCEARFPWKNITRQGAVGLITCKFTSTSQRKKRFAWENTRKVNPRMWQDSCEAHSAWKKTRNVGAIDRSTCTLQSPQDAPSLQKHMESGRVSATHVLAEKRYGFWERLVARHMNLQSQWTQSAFYLRKTQGMWGGW